MYRGVVVGKTEPAKQEAVESAKWLALGEVVHKATAPVVAVVMGRLLSPTEFGVFGIAIMVNAFAQMFWDAGLSRALIQAKEADDKTVNAVFWTNIGSALLLYVLLVLSADNVAGFFGAPSAGAVLRIMGVGMILAAASSVHVTLLIRTLDFRGQFLPRLTVSLLPPLASIPMAFFNYGVWALVTGCLVGQLIGVLLLWTACPWRPRWPIDLAVARRVLKAGRWHFGESFTVWCYNQGDSVVVATFLSVHDLGLYRVGRAIVDMAYGTTLRPLFPIAYPWFSRLQDSRAQLITALGKANALLFSAIWPLTVGLVILGPWLVDLAYGARWHGLGPVVAVLSAAWGIDWIVGFNSEVYRATGRADLNAKLLLVGLVFYLPTFIVSAMFGIQAFVWARLILNAAALWMHLYVAKRVLGLPLFYAFRQGKVFAVAAVAAGGILIVMKWALSPHAGPGAWMWAAVVTGAGLATYVAVIWMLDRAFLQWVYSMFRSAIGPQTRNSPT